MLVYTGFRLAHPREFVNILPNRSRTTIDFRCDHYWGTGDRSAAWNFDWCRLKILLHVVHGVPLSSIFKPFLEVEQIDDNNCVIRAHKSAIFSNWIPFRRQIEDLGLVQRQNVTIDFFQYETGRQQHFGKTA